MSERTVDAARPGEAGRAMVEAVALAAVLIAVLAVLATSSTVIGDRFSEAVRTLLCRAAAVVTGQACPGDVAEERLDIACTTATAARDITYNLTVFSVRGESGAGDVITTLGDGTTQVTTSATNRLGAHASKGARTSFHRRLGMLSQGRYAGGGVSLGGTQTHTYTFDPGDHDDTLTAAAEFLGERRGSVRRELAALLGNQAGTVEQTFDYGGALTHEWFGWGEAPLLPSSSSYRVDTVIDGESGFGGATGGVDGRGNLGGGGEIVYDHVEDTSTFIGDWATGVGGTANAPFIGGVRGDRDWRWRHIVAFDADGNPTGYTAVAERTTTGGMEAGARLRDSLEALGGGDATLSGSGSSAGGEGTIVQRHLDLDDPDNLAAFRQAYDTYAGLVAVPRPGQRDALDRRLDDDALDVDFVYDVQDSRWGAGGDLERLGLEGGSGWSFGVVRDGSSTTTALREALVTDRRSGGGSRPLRTCGPTTTGQDQDTVG